MSVGCPTPEFAVHQLVLFVEGLCATHACVVACPPTDDGIELGDERELRGSPASPHDFLQSSLMCLASFLAGLDDGLEAEWLSVGTVRCAVFPHRELPDSESQEIKPGLLLSL